MKKSLSILAVASCLVGMAPSAMATIYCQGSVVNLYVSESGDVIFQPTYRNDYTKVCNLQGDWQGISTETCFAWYGQLMAAKIHAKNVLLQYDGIGYTCANISTYGNSPKAGYVMVTD
jgi:hypothetical protein